jgi:hypothetical protein
MQLCLECTLVGLATEPLPLHRRLPTVKEALATTPGPRRSGVRAGGRPEPGGTRRNPAGLKMAARWERDRRRNWEQTQRQLIDFETSNFGRDFGMISG